MKSVVCKVFGMTATVACLALIFNRPSQAEDQPKQDTQEVTKSITVQAEHAGEDVAKALEKALHDKLSELPKEIQQKIRQELQAVKKANAARTVVSAKDLEKKADSKAKTMVVTVTADGKANVKQVIGELDIQTYQVQADGDGKTVQVIASDANSDELQPQVLHIVAEKKAAAEAHAKEARDKALTVKKRIEATLKKLREDHEQELTKRIETVTITTDAHPKADAKKIGIAVVAIEGGDDAVKSDSKNVTVKVEDGKLIVNGKKLDLPQLEEVGKGQFRIEVRGVASQPKKLKQRKMIFKSNDGKVSELPLQFNIEVKDEEAQAGESTETKTVTATAHAFVVGGKSNKQAAEQQGKWIVQLDGKGTKGVYTITLSPKDEGQAKAGHIFHIGPNAADDAHADVTKRLKGIESELKKIRSLLEKMQKDENDEDDDD